MSVIHPGLFLIMRQYPSMKDTLRRKYQNSESFQTLCDDYQRCLEAIAYWEGSTQVRAPERFNEYQVLKQSLEWEIETTLAETL